MSRPLILANAEVITADDRFRGFVVVDGETIIEVGAGAAPERGLDLGGDYLMPGLVEVHTDNLEAHYVPRPKVEWHMGGAVQAYDAQIATAGITTVFDSLRIGLDESETRSTFALSALPLADAIADAAEQGLLRADHRLHMRCEVPTLDVVDGLEKFLAHHPIHLISLMDHTPGQRQFRSLEKYFIYYGGRTGKSDEEVREIVARRQAHGAERTARNRPLVIEIARRHGIPLASHDDTTVEEVAQSVADGVTIAEFPTTIEAAEASRQAGMLTVMGAPNVVRGGSHSGNVAAVTLAEIGTLDILSSDYVPASLLVAAYQLQEVRAVGGLPGAIRLVSKNPAAATGLTDRGEIAVGLRADLIRVRRAGGGQPVVMQVWRGGERVA
jgi:alpha-D-ribose 1-methylphosphonate 5-triphosphate diphosphatase